jgi:1-acyl-sn-glycerol-3-phosphate acyltransferase
MNNVLVRGALKIAAGLKSAYEYAILYISLALFGTTGLAYTLIGAVLYPLLPRRFGARLGRLIMTGLFRLDLSALDTLGDETIIIAPNHPSLIDVVLIGSRLTNVVCIMKADIQDNIMFGGAARLAGYIRNDSIGNMVRTSVAGLKEGSQLLIFPEGTRTTAHPLNKFKSAFALIARKSGAPVQTVFIESNTRFLGKGWPLMKKPQFPLIYKVTLGMRFEASSDTKTFVDDMEKYYREQLALKSLSAK